jgi:hypothetical protein
MRDSAETAVLAGAATGSCSNCCATAMESSLLVWDGPAARTTTRPRRTIPATPRVEVTFDPERTSYRELLEFFFQFHRADLGEHLVGSSYRSAIFCASEEQRKVAEDTICDVDASSHWPGKIVTEISEAGPFWAAQAEDQDYFQRYPEGCAPPSCGGMRNLPNARSVAQLS